MPHTLRDVTAAGKEAASLTMPAGSGPGGHSGLAHPHRTEEGRQGTYRCQAEEARSPAPCRLGPAGLRRPGQADGSPRRHRRGRGGPAPPGPPGSSACTPRGPSTADRARGPGGWPTLSCPAPTTRARHRGPGRRRPPGRDTGQDPRHRSPAGLIRRPGAGDQEVRILDQGRARLPRRQQTTQDSHVRLRPRLPALRPRLQGPLPAQTRPGKPPGQAVTAPAHRRVLTPHAMIRHRTLHDPQSAAQPPTTA